MTEHILAQLASTGVVGVLLVLAILALRAKDAALIEEQHSRIEDAKAYLALAMALQKEVIAAVSKLADIVEIFERRETERERREGRDRP
jgi:energy-converting hydrogenase A subunit M